MYNTVLLEGVTSIQDYFWFNFAEFFDIDGDNSMLFCQANNSDGNMIILLYERRYWYKLIQL